MLRRCLLPESEVIRCTLVLLSVEVACAFLHLVESASRKYAVLVVSVVFEHVEIDRAVALVCISGLKNLLHEVDLLDDVS